MPDLPALARSLLPDGVAVAGGPIADLQAPLLAGEAASLARARPPRRADFTAGRTAARQALAQLGHSAFPLPRDPRGPAVWPEGITGSISHGAGFALAAVARRDGFAGLGVDIEAAGAFVPLEAVAGSEEIAALGRLDPVVLFSAKEAAYKAQFALTGRMFGFRDLVLTLDGAQFTARPGPSAPPLPAITGRWLQAEGVIITAAAIATWLQPIAWRQLAE